MNVARLRAGWAIGNGWVGYTRAATTRVVPTDSATEKIPPALRKRAGKGEKVR